MATYRVSAVKRLYLETTVEADSYEEAMRIADSDLIIDDFETVNVDFTLTHVG